MERLQHLTSDQRRSIGNWVADLEPLKERYPILAEVDLVVEGGVGTGQTMAHIARAFFPKATYVGMDIAPTLMAGKPRQLQQVDPGVLREVIEANSHPTLEMEDTILHANCFDAELVRHIAQQVGAQMPFLVSFNALNALVDRKMNPWDRKDDSDITTIDEVVTGQLPYRGQIHILNGDVWGDAISATGRNFSTLEAAASRSGWQTERLDCGLLMLKKH